MKLNYPKVILVVVLLTLFSFFLKNSFHKMNDFKVTHRAATRVLEGENLYNWADGHYLYKYPPFFALLVVPFGLIPFFYAKFFWMALMIAAFYGVVRIGKYLVMDHKSPPPFFYSFSFLLTAKFLLREIELGQADFLQLFFIFSFLMFLEKKREISSGLFLALSVMIKLTPLIFIPYLLYKKRFLSLFCSLCFTIFFFSLPALIYGFDGNLVLLKDWYNVMSSSSPVLLANDMNQSIFGMFYRFLTPSAYDVNFASLNPNLVNGLIYIIIAGAYAYLLFLNRFSKRISNSLTHTKEALEYSFLLIFVALFSPLGWIQNFSSLILASMILVYYSLKSNFKDKLVSSLLIFSFVLGSAINYETVGRRLNDLSLYCSFITMGVVFVLIGLSKLRLSRIA